jgi:hypothetical protein
VEEWVKVAAVPNETLALVMKGLLDDAGIPALVQRGSGFDVPDFLSAGPRDAWCRTCSPGKPGNS